MRKLYKSCSTLPIGKFFRIFETEDLRNLVVGFDFENDDFKLSKNEQKECEYIFQDIYYEYSELSENHKLRGIFVKRSLIAEWTFLYTLISQLLKIYEEHKNHEVLVLINEIDDKQYHINLEKPIEGEIKILNNKLKGLKNKIKIYKIKLVNSIEQGKTETKIDLDRDALYIERNLELKRVVDPETTSVKSWLNLIKINKEKAKRNGKNPNNKSRSRRTN
jgi:stress response protein YsnF